MVLLELTTQATLWAFSVVVVAPWMAVSPLIAEKSNTARQAIVEALTRLDAIAVQGAVADLQGAVRALCRHPPDLVITGIELADASGLDLIEATRQLAPSSHVVVVGAPTRDVWRRQAAAGRVRFVPAEPELRELCSVVASLARRSTDAAVQMAAVTALQSYKDPAAAAAVLEALPKFRNGPLRMRAFARSPSHTREPDPRRDIQRAASTRSPDRIHAAPVMQPHALHQSVRDPLDVDLPTVRVPR